MDLSTIKDLYVGSTPAQSVWLGGTKVWERKTAVDIQSIFDAMVLWYDPKRQGATNESMAATPELVNLAYDPDKAHVIDWTQFSTRGDGVQQFSIEITSTTNYWVINQGAYHRTNSIPSFYVEVSNLPEGKVINYFYGNGSDERQTYAITYNGLHKLPACKISPNVTTASGFFINNENGQTVADVVGTTITQVNPSMNATCYNFAWNVQSGIDDGQVTFEDFGVLNGGTIKTHTLNVPSGQGILKSYPTFTKNINSFIVRISNYTSEALASIMYYYRGSDGMQHNVVIQKDGTYVMPVNYTTVDGNGTYAGFAFQYKSEYDPNTDNPPTVTLEILPPTYPNALVADGVDDYAKVEGLPILTDYTVIAKRKILSELDGTYKTFACKGISPYQGAFILERQTNTNKYEIYSFGQGNVPTEIPTDITYMTSDSYNGNPIAKGDSIDEDIVHIFSRDDQHQCISAVLYSFILFNRTLTEEEINWVKDNLIEGTYKNPEALLIDAWVFSGHTNEEAPTKITGEKGTALNCYNFAWNEEGSGFKDGFLCFDGVNDGLSTYKHLPLLKTVIAKYVIPKQTYNNHAALMSFADVPNRNVALNYYDNSISKTSLSSRMSGYGSLTYDIAQDEVHTDYLNTYGRNGEPYTKTDTTEMEDTYQITMGCIYNNIAYMQAKIAYVAIYSESLTDAECMMEIKRLDALWESRKQ